MCYEINANVKIVTSKFGSHRDEIDEIRRGILVIGSSYAVQSHFVAEVGDQTKQEI